MSYVIVCPRCLKLHAPPVSGKVWGNLAIPDMSGKMYNATRKVEIVLIVGCPGSRGLGTLAGACGGCKGGFADLWLCVLPRWHFNVNVNVVLRRRFLSGARPTSLGGGRARLSADTGVPRGGA